MHMYTCVYACICVGWPIGTVGTHWCQDAAFVVLIGTDRISLGYQSWRAVTRMHGAWGGVVWPIGAYCFVCSVERIRCWESIQWLGWSSGCASEAKKCELLCVFGGELFINEWWLQARCEDCRTCCLISSFTVNFFVQGLLLPKWPLLKSIKGHGGAWEHSNIHGVKKKHLDLHTNIPTWGMSQQSTWY